MFRFSLVARGYQDHLRTKTRSPIMVRGLPGRRSPVRAPKGNGAGGKSGLHRAACRLTAGGARSKRVLRKVPQKTIPPGGEQFLSGKGEKVR
jgi:hypothetical protein